VGKHFDITPYLAEIIERLNRGDSLRMVASYIGIDHCTLSNKLKAIGYLVPSKAASAKRTWKNHVHPRLGKKGELCPVYGKKMTTSTRQKMIPIWKKNADDMRLYSKKHSGGYTLVYKPEHPRADSTGYVLEHRIIVETKLGRYLSSDEIVHHKNGIKTDNNVDNLIVISKSEHAKIHNNLGEKKYAQ